mgnify:CR=1 FL=1
MRKIKLIICLFVLALFTYSCEDELVEKNSNQNSISKATLKNGRLWFQSKEEFSKTFQSLADASEYEIYNYFQPLYEKGFYSLRPIVTEKNEEFLYKHYIKIVKNNELYRTSSRSSMDEDDESIFDYLDDLEDIVGDDVFAAFLNNEAEIVIADDIYKYTDVGLFISKEDKLNILIDVLENKNVSTDITIPTSTSAKQSILNEFPNDGLSPVNGDVSYFRVLYLAPDDSGGGGSSGSGSSGGGSYTPTPGAPTSTDPSYNAFINNLTSCNPSSGTFGNFFFNIFGDNNVCIDKYERRRRVKTKAFNYNYFIGFHLGVKCVHQYRGWTGFWRTEATDEIRLVVEAAQFEYDLDKLLGNSIINNNSQIKDFYLNNQRINYGPNNINVGGPFGFSYSNLNHSSLPQIFQNNGMGLTFEFFGTGWTWLDSQIQGGINSSLNAKKLNEHFYSTLYSETTSLLRSALNNNSYNAPANRTFSAKFPENGKLIVQKAVLDQGFGIGIRQKTFDFGAEIRFNASQNGDNSWSISGGQGSVLTRPKKLRVKIIGAARRGSAWHGSKFNKDIQ